MIFGVHAPGTIGPARSGKSCHLRKDEPRPISGFQPMTPPALDHLVKTCLAKDPDDRWQTAGEIARQLKWVVDAGSGAGLPAVVVGARKTRERWIWALVGAFAAAVVTGLAVWALTQPAPGAITRFPVVLPQTQQLTNTGRRSIAISPTGSHLVYVANSQLYLRPMDQVEAVPLSGTEGSAPTIPFFSPDGQWIGFYSTRDSQLKKIAVTGGAAVTLCDASNPLGARWGADDTIVFGQGAAGIFQVPGAGGTPELLIAVNAEQAERAHGPQVLPGGAAVLFTLAGEGGFQAWNDAQIVVESLDSGERRVVIDGATDARYLPTGHLVYALAGTLLAVPFDVDRLEVTGGPVPLVEGVRHATLTGAANFDVSRDGSLTYLPGVAGAGVEHALAWVDREGREEPLAAEPRTYIYPRISPDGSRVALDVRDQERDIWIWDFARETLTRLTFGPGPDYYPVWTPDGEHVAFSSGREGTLNLFLRAADGTGAVNRLTESPNVQYPYAFSSDGQRLVIPRGQS